MRVLTWNVWWKFGPWKDRQPALAAELERLNADVMFLQEIYADPAGEDQAETLAAIGDWHLARSRTENGDPDEFGNAILSRFPIKESRTVRLPDRSGVPAHRSVVIAVVDTERGPQVMASTHLAYQFDQSLVRQSQLQVVIDALLETRASLDPDLPIILAGDLNAVPHSDEIRRLTGASEPYRDGIVFTDSWAAVTDDPGYTWTRDNPHTPDAKWPRRRLDYVFVSWPRPTPVCNPQQASIEGCEPRSGVVASDHYGVLVQLDDRPTREP